MPCKPRPVLIVQDDRFHALHSITALPLTPVGVEVPLLRVLIPAPGTSGLVSPSSVMIDKLTTVRRGNVVDLVGRITTRQMLQAERALLVFLGLAA